MDAFAVAFKIPNLLRRFFGEGAFSQAFVPVISEYRATRSPTELRDLIDRASGTLALVLFAITLIGVIAAPLVILVFAPGFLDDAGRFPIAVRMLRLTFPYVFFVSLTALAGSILNAHRRFAVAAFTPVLLNVVMIGFAGWVEPRLPWPGRRARVGRIRRRRRATVVSAAVPEPPRPAAATALGSRARGSAADLSPDAAGDVRVVRRAGQHLGAIR